MTKLLQTTTGIHIAIFRLEYNSRFKRPYTATLPGDTEFGWKIIFYMCDWNHGSILLLPFS